MLILIDLLPIAWDIQWRKDMSWLIAIFFKLMKLTLALCLSLLMLQGYGQSDLRNTKDSLPQLLGSYTSKFPQEKVYLVTDRPYYAIGDTLWFQSYLVDAKDHLFLAPSAIIYVNLLDVKGQLIERQVLYGPNGRLPGAIEIDKEWEAGSYLLRAYTRWMLEFDPSLVYQKRIEIYPLLAEDASDAQATPLEGEVATKDRAEEAGVPTVDFVMFPEGGDRICGLAGLIAFKATLHDTGEGIKVEGRVLDAASGLVIGIIQSNDEGLGKLTVPGHVENILVQLDLPYNTNLKIPDCVSQGYALSISNRYQSDQLRVSLRTNTQPGLKGCVLIGQTRGGVFFNYTIHKDVSELALSVDKSIIPSGIAQFTLFDAHGVPQAERLVFVDHGDRTVSASLEANAQYKKRQLVELQLAIPEEQEGTVALAVTNAEAVWRDPDATDLNSFMLLQSDLGGMMANAGYYVNDPTKEAHTFLDQLLLTKGWRRFAWERIVDTLDLLPPERSIVISGQLQNFTFRSEPVKGMIELICLRDGFYYADTISDGEGRFRFDGLHFYDSATFHLQSKKKASSTSYRFYIDLDEMPELAMPRLGVDPRLMKETQEAFAELSYRSYVIEKSHDPLAIMLDEVRVEGRKEDRATEISSARAGYFQADYRLYADSVSGGANSLYDLLQRLPLVQVTRDGEVAIRGASARFFLDGVQLSEASMGGVINSTPASDVYFIDVDRVGQPGLIGGPAVYVYTRSGNGIPPSQLYNDQSTPGIIKKQHPGYTRVRQFYAPNYHPQAGYIEKPDHRLLVYWNPEVIISDGKANISFYTGDLAGSYEVIVEGFTSNGDVIKARGGFLVR